MTRAANDTVRVWVEFALPPSLVRKLRAPGPALRAPDARVVRSGGADAVDALLAGVRLTRGVVKVGARHDFVLR
jgi:hypothetical protein